ncbi:GatB/YqeY domain-containing protein [bacterium]|nr:GatB/YqeY domain-containing protein [bacterium]MCB2201903.1 GatB/YqeY domain-containing protein [bacterium]
MSILQQIDQDLIKALKAGEKQKATVLRGLKSDLKYAQIERKEELGDQQMLDVLASAAKKRRESIEQYQNAGRDDLANKELFELAVIQAYLPVQLSEDEIRQIITDAVAETGADSPSKMGLVMQAVMPKVKGRADGKLVNKLVQEILAK